MLRAYYMHGTPSRPIGCVIAIVLSVGRYTSGSMLAHRPSAAMTRIKRTIHISNWTQSLFGMFSILISALSAPVYSDSSVAESPLMGCSSNKGKMLRSITVRRAAFCGGYEMHQPID